MEINKEIYKIVSDYHTATQGPYAEEKAMEKIYEQAKITYGVDEVMKVVEFYNATVIRKAV
jgi:GR25 family glycosyltransferase involved in LPS biosynthesis